jgi:microcystin degradation protein MlrC
MEGKDGVLSVSIGDSFPYADVAELTGRSLVFTDNTRCRPIGYAIGQEFVGMCRPTAPECLDTDASIRRCVGVRWQPSGDGRSRRQWRRRAG